MEIRRKSHVIKKKMNGKTDVSKRKIVVLRKYGRSTSHQSNYLGGDPMVRVWDQKICPLCGLRFEPYSCSYNNQWRLTWSLTSGPVELVEVRTN